MFQKDNNPTIEQTTDKLFIYITYHNYNCCNSFDKISNDPRHPNKLFVFIS